MNVTSSHDDVIKWRHYPRYWPFVREIHRSPVNSLTKASDAEFDVFFDLCLNKQLSEQSRRWWFETLWHPLWRQYNANFLHDPPWISPWIKSISNELDITFHVIDQNCLVIVTSSAIDCDVINIMKTGRVIHGDDVWRSSFLSSFMSSLYRVRNKIMRVLSWKIVYALSRVLFLVCIKHQNNPIVST